MAVGLTSSSETYYVGCVPKEDADLLYPDDIDQSNNLSAGEKCPHCQSGDVDPARQGCERIIGSWLVIPILFHILNQ